MPRVISTALQTEHDKTITRVGYLLSITMATSVLQLSNIGDVTWNSKLFINSDFNVSGIGGGSDGRLTIQNLDKLVGDVFASMDMSNVTCDVYYVAPSAVALSDVKQLGKYSFGDCDIGLDILQVQLIALNAFSPRRRIDPSFGFYYAMPDGSKITWEGETYIVGQERG
jgi:hypothetical protein